MANATAPGVLARDPVFAVGDEVFDWADVLLWDHDEVSWDDRLKAAHKGLNCELWQARSAAATEDLEAAVAIAASEFRYARGLDLAEDMRRWLARRCLSPADWLGYIRRSLLRQREADTLMESAIFSPLHAEDIWSVVWVDGLCSGGFDRQAYSLAAAATAAMLEQEASGQDDPGGEIGSLPIPKVGNWGIALDIRAEEGRRKMGRLGEIKHHAARFRERVAPPHEVRDLTAAHSIFWMHIEGWVLPPHNVEAQEYSPQGLEGWQVPDGPGTPPGARSFSLPLEDVDATARACVLAATLGQWAGPVRWKGGPCLVRVDSRIPPSANNPAVRERVKQLLFDRAIGEAIVARVHWSAMT